MKWNWEKLTNKQETILLRVLYAIDIICIAIFMYVLVKYFIL